MLDSSLSDKLLTSVDEDGKTKILINETLCELDSLLAQFRQVELASNSIQVKLSVEPLEACYEMFGEDDDLVLQVYNTVENVLAQYNTWETQRDRLLTGRAGAFFDFAELTSVITDFARTFNCTTYSSLYDKMCECIEKYTNGEDRNNPFYEILYQEESNIITEGSAETETMFKVSAITALRASGKFTPFHLAYIVYKLKNVKELEVAIMKCVDTISKL